MNRPQGRGATALEKHYAFLLWLLPTVEQFPRGQKFLLGDRMQTTALTILDALVEATYSRRPEAALGRANLELEKLRLLCRLAQVPASPRCGSRVGRVSRRVFAGVTRLVV